MLPPTVDYYYFYVCKFSTISLMNNIKTVQCELYELCNYICATECVIIVGLHDRLTNCICAGTTCWTSVTT